jgi:O-antigen ligase
VSRALALVPALLLAAFAFALGTFDGAARAAHGALGAGALLAVALLAAPRLLDPLRLGRAGWLWPALLVLAVAASWRASEIPRAGDTALALLPALLLLPAAVARAWRDPGARRLGLAAWSATVAAVGVWALADWAARDATRTAEPLGHHNLLAVFLVTALPVALAGGAAPGWGRALALAAAGAGGAALVLTRSFTVLAAAGLVALGVSFRLGRLRRLVAGAALVALGLAVPRADAIVRGADRSAQARLTYAEAAWSGARERPLLGWGPGSAPWTLAAFVAPRPGVNPPGELVGEPHSTPLALAYELGAAGLAASALLAVLCAVARWRERRAAADGALYAAGAAGAAAALLAALGTSWLAVPALPVAFALTLGAALAAAPSPPEPKSRWPWAAVAFYALGAGAGLAPRLRAEHAAERATAQAAPVERERLLREAVRLDPRFPLYRARRAWEGSGALAARAKAAAEAAKAAKGVGPLWLKAGALALEANQHRIAIGALERAVALDPLSGSTPFLLYVATNGERVDCAARAFLGEPKLAAATWFRGRERERQRALAQVRQWPGIDLGWRLEFVQRAGGALAAGGEEVDLVQRIDADPARAASLHLFRRAPAPTELSRIRIDRARAERLDLPAASALASSARSAFPARRCRPR